MDLLYLSNSDVDFVCRATHLPKHTVVSLAGQVGRRLETPGAGVGTETSTNKVGESAR